MPDRYYDVTIPYSSGDFFGPMYTFGRIIRVVAV